MPGILPWCRLYHEVLDDRKLKRICAATEQPMALVLGAWATLLALASKSPERGSLMIAEGIWLTQAELRAEMGLDQETFDGLMQQFVSLNMVADIGDGQLALAHWNSRNFKSDNSTARVQEWREQQRSQPEEVQQHSATEDNVAETLPQHLSNVIDTDTEADAETDSTATPSQATAPTDFAGWQALLQEAKNPNGTLRFLYETVFPGRSPPDYGYLGKAARKVGGAGRLADLMWQCSSRPPTGDVLAFCIAMAKGGSSKQQADPLGDYHRLAKKEGWE